MERKYLFCWRAGRASIPRRHANKDLMHVTTCGTALVHVLWGLLRYCCTAA